jgi:hypothetical protein
MQQPLSASTRKLFLLGGGLVIFLAGAMCLAVVVYLGGQGVTSRLEQAVRASFPTFCAQSGEKMRLEWVPPFYAAAGEFDHWVVFCEPGPVSWGQAAMEIDVSSCTVDSPEDNRYGMDWGSTYGTLFDQGQRMPVCP